MIACCLQILSYQVVPAPVFTTDLFSGDELPTLDDPHTIKASACLLRCAAHALALPAWNPFAEPWRGAPRAASRRPPSDFPPAGRLQVEIKPHSCQVGRAVDFGTTGLEYGSDPPAGYTPTGEPVCRSVLFEGDSATAGPGGASLALETDITLPDCGSVVDIIDQVLLPEVAEERLAALAA